MAKPTVRDFRSPRICQRVFANTSEAIILEAINAAYDDYRIRRNLRSTVLAAAHLIARDDDDIMAMEGVAANAVDFGSRRRDYCRRDGWRSSRNYSPRGGSIARIDQFCVVRG